MDTTPNMQVNVNNNDGIGGGAKPKRRKPSTARRPSAALAMKTQPQIDDFLKAMRNPPKEKDKYEESTSDEVFVENSEVEMTDLGNCNNQDNNNENQKRTIENTDITPERDARKRTKDTRDDREEDREEGPVPQGRSKEVSET